MHNQYLKHAYSLAAVIRIMQQEVAKRGHSWDAFSFVEDFVNSPHTLSSPCPNDTTMPEHPEPRHYRYALNRQLAYAPQLGQRASFTKLREALHKLWPDVV